MGSEARENALEEISKTELETKLAEANKKIIKLELELSETKRKCDAQVQSLDLKQQESEAKIRLLERTLDVQNEKIEQMGYSAPIQEQGATVQQDIKEKERKLSKEQKADIRETEYAYEASAKQTTGLSLNVPANNANRTATKVKVRSSPENVTVSIQFSG